MTNEQIIQWAREAGFDVYPALQEVDGGFEQLQAFANLVRNATLEEAAVKCEKKKNRTDQWSDDSEYVENSLIETLAKDIRSMKS